MLFLYDSDVSAAWLATNMLGSLNDGYIITDNHIYLAKTDINATVD